MRSATAQVSWADFSDMSSSVAVCNCQKGSILCACNTMVHQMQTPLLYTCTVTFGTVQCNQGFTASGTKVSAIDSL